MTDASGAATPHDGRMPRNLRLAGVAAAVAALLALPTGAALAASPDEARQFTYVAGDAQMWAAGVVGQPHDTPAGPVAVATSIDGVPTRASFTIHIDDYALPDGKQLWVQVHSGDKWVFQKCVPVRSETTIPASPGKHTSVSIGKVYGTGCGAQATAGVLTVRGLG